MAAKPSIHACSFGNPPDPDKITTYPGVARRDWAARQRFSSPRGVAPDPEVTCLMKLWPSIGRRSMPNERCRVLPSLCSENVGSLRWRGLSNTIRRKVVQGPVGSKMSLNSNNVMNFRFSQSHAILVSFQIHKVGGWCKSCCLRIRSTSVSRKRWKSWRSKSKTSENPVGHCGRW